MTSILRVEAVATRDCPELGFKRQINCSRTELKEIVNITELKVSPTTDFDEACWCSCEALDFYFGGIWFESQQGYNIF